MQQQLVAETDEMTPAELLPLFYEEYNLGDDGGLSSPVVRIDVKKGIHFFIPNYDARRKAVPWHDIHHLVTGYSAGTFLGECEISAWEIASGCGKYWAAFIIDTSGVWLGCFIHPKKILQAFARGRRTANLYHDRLPLEQVMKMSIEEIRKGLQLDKFPMETKANVHDLLGLGLFLVFAGLYSIISILQLPLLLLFNICYYVKRRFF